jgi:hypothetical protein
MAEVRMQILPPKGAAAPAESVGSTVISDGTMPCPVPSDSGLPCVKRIPEGWTADMGHGGGHWWMSPETSRALDRGHYDARAALAGESFTIHQPEQCFPGCPQYPGNWLDLLLRRGTTRKETQ